MKKYLDNTLRDCQVMRDKTVNWSGPVSGKLAVECVILVCSTIAAGFSALSDEQEKRQPVMRRLGFD